MLGRSVNMATWPWCHLLTTETLKISKLQQSVSAMTVRLSHCALSCNCKVSQLARLCRLAMGEGQPADIVAAKEEVWAKSATPMAYRSREEILRFFNGLDLVDPGLTTVTRWREEFPDPQLDAAGSWTLAGVGRKS